MRIEGVTLHASGRRPTLQWNAVTAGVNVVYDPPPARKTSLAEFLAHVLFGQLPGRLMQAERGSFVEGEVIVQSGAGRYRLRRYQKGASTPQLAVAALDGSPVDHTTIHGLVGGLSPAVLGPLCAVSFHESPSIGRLLSPEFTRSFASLGGSRPSHSSRRMAELASRRDLLAQELETRIAGERRVSKELDGRWRELDRLVREQQQQAAAWEQRLHSVETALAETDARLRYRRLELNVELRWQVHEPEDCAPQLAELDDQIARWRSTLADLGQREASVRARLAENLPAPGAAAAAMVDQRAWLGVARHLAADLAGEVARLARASDSQQCVCHDAHPRLRPIAETIQRQLERLESLVNDQQRAVDASDLQEEAEHLGRTQAELRRHVESLLDRRQANARGVKPSRRRVVQEPNATSADAGCREGGDGRVSFSAADAEQLEERRLELEQERFQLVEQLRSHSGMLRDLRAQRDTVERQRAALLSARSIEHVQRELADVQRKLEQAAGSVAQREDGGIAAEDAARAPDFLAQLTDGGLVQLVLVEHGRRARVVNRHGESLPVEALTIAERDLVYLSLCLGRLSAAAQRGVWLPLVLEDPFRRLDSGGTAALAAVLDDFCRQGHQVLVFTSQAAAAERLSAVGASVHEIGSLQQVEPTVQAESVPPAPRRRETTQRELTKQQSKRGHAQGAKKKIQSPKKPLDGEGAASERSDAA